MRTILALVITGVLLAGGCDRDSTGPDPNAHVGTYNLVTVNGNGLPFTYTSEGFPITLVSGRVTLSADGNASYAIRFRLGIGSSSAEDTATRAGTYTRTGDSIAVRWNDANESETLAYRNNELTSAHEAFTLVFRK